MNIFKLRLSPFKFNVFRNILKCNITTIASDTSKISYKYKYSMYKIVHKDINITECYVGYTSNFMRRQSEQRRVCNNVNSMEYNNPVYKYIRANGNWSNWSMIVIETYKCNTITEAMKRKRNLIEILKLI